MEIYNNYVVIPEVGVNKEISSINFIEKIYSLNSS